MKKVLFFSIVLTCLSFTQDRTINVYLCISETAEVYHFKRNCRGLKQCTHTIKVVPLEVAKKKYKRRVCGWENG